MPSIVTHHSFANTVLNKANNINVNKDIYNVFAQSFDYFFYYNFFDFKNKSKIENFGHYCHKNKTQNYLINLIKNIKEMHLEENSDALGYLYGSITHYVLDTNCHPYIFYKTGCFDKGDKESYKYRGMHTKMEKHLDAFFSKQFFKKIIYKLNIRKEIIGNAKFSQELIDLLNKTFEDTYNKKNMAKYFIKSYNFSKFTYNVLCQDKYGIKRKIYKFVDFVARKRLPLFVDYSTYIRNEDISYLNIEHKPWHHPCNNEVHNDSFLDLYNDSIIKALKIFKEVDKNLNEREDIEKITDIIEDLSYTTGLPLDKNRGFRYFEY
ncbi:MAG: zinc dependent phospholipase C family protein [Bacilli bacterium]